MPKIKKVCMYARVATCEQLDEKYKKQIDAVQNYCADNDLTLMCIYKECASGLSSIAERPAGGEMVEACRRGLYDTIIVSDLSRIYRRPIEVLKFENEMSALGVTVLSVANEHCGAAYSFGALLHEMFQGVKSNARRNKCIER